MAVLAEYAMKKTEVKIIKNKPYVKIIDTPSKRTANQWVGRARRNGVVTHIIHKKDRTDMRRNVYSLYVTSSQDRKYLQPSLNWIKKTVSEVF